MKFRIKKIQDKWFLMEGSRILKMYETRQDAEKALMEICQ